MSLAEEFQVSARQRGAELVTLKLRRGLSGSLGESLGSWEGSGAERGCQNFCVTCSFGNWAVRGNELVALTYKRYPYTATRSEIAERVLAGDAAALERISSARPGADGPRVQTIGYEGHTLESYLNVLLQAGVSLLCDVRRNPISRKYGFSKKALSKGCEGVGLGYEHVPELGIDSSQRRNLNTQADYDALFAEYERDALPRQTAALDKLAGWVKSGERIALTCYEHLPHQCHRHCVADALAKRFGKSFSPAHL